MVKKMLAAAIIACMWAPANANDVEDQCRAYVEENGGDASGCACLGDAADGDAELAAAIAAIDSPEALEAADDSTKEAIAACFPDAG